MLKSREGQVKGYYAFLVKNFEHVKYFFGSEIHS